MWILSSEPDTMNAMAKEKLYNNNKQLNPSTQSTTSTTTSTSSSFEECNNTTTSSGAVPESPATTSTSTSTSSSALPHHATNGSAPNGKHSLHYEDDHIHMNGAEPAPSINTVSSSSSSSTSASEEPAISISPVMNGHVHEEQGKSRESEDIIDDPSSSVPPITTSSTKSSPHVPPVSASSLSKNPFIPTSPPPLPTALKSSNPFDEDFNSSPITTTSTTVTTTTTPTSTPTPTATASPIPNGEAGVDWWMQDCVEIKSGKVDNKEKDTKPTSPTVNNTTNNNNAQISNALKTSIENLNKFSNLLSRNTNTTTTTGYKNYFQSSSSSNNDIIPQHFIPTSPNISLYTTPASPNVNAYSPPGSPTLYSSPMSPNLYSAPLSPNSYISPSYSSTTSTSTYPTTSTSTTATTATTAATTTTRTPNNYATRTTTGREFELDFGEGPSISTTSTSTTSRDDVDVVAQHVMDQTSTMSPDMGREPPMSDVDPIEESVIDEVRKSIKLAFTDIQLLRLLLCSLITHVKRFAKLLG